MRKVLWLLLSFSLVNQPGWSCGGGGCGGGNSHVNTTHGKFEQRSYAEIAAFHQRDAVETEAIEKWSKFASKLESQKRWAEAEQSYRYVLGLVSFRDGPGSFSSIPALEHLIKVSKAQHKLNEAIRFQQTALALTKAQPNANKEKILNAQLNLGDLLVQKQDYSEAQSVLKDTVAMYDAQPSLPQQKRGDTCKLYAKILHQLHKDSQASIIEAALAAGKSQPSLEKIAETKQVILSQNANSK